MQGHTQIIELLADKFKVSVFERTRDGSTLMHIASLHGHPETAMALFRKGVPLQMPNKVEKSISCCWQNAHILSATNEACFTSRISCYEKIFFLLCRGEQEVCTLLPDMVMQP